MSVKFKDNRIEVKDAIGEAVLAFLHEASGEVSSQTSRNTAVDTGQLKGSWDYRVDESKFESKIGSPLENAIWEEFGTGEYALEHNGRKTPWRYKDRHGKWHTTIGKKPRRALYRAFTALKPSIVARAESELKSKLK